MLATRYPTKEKEKVKGQGKSKGPPLPNGKGKGGKGKGKGKSQPSKSSAPAPEGKGQSKGSTPGGKPAGGAGGKPSGEAVKRKPKQCVFYASSAGCVRGKSCPFLHQNDSVTKKPLPADPADVQRMKGKLQSVPKAVNGGAPAVATAVPVPSSGATSSTAPVPVLQVSMLRVDRQQLEPEPELIRRHPVAEWRPHAGPTPEKHPRFLLSMPRTRDIDTAPYGWSALRAHCLWCQSISLLAEVFFMRENLAHVFFTDILSV